MIPQIHHAIAFLPLDDRPPNIEFPALLAESAGLRPMMPPKEWLGNPWRSGDCLAFANWLDQVAPHVDALIVAIDTLGYGGLVNSRRVSDNVETVLERLDLLHRLKREHPSLTILGYSILMRISRHNSAEEEKSYWASYGERIFRISYLEDRLTMMAGEPGDEDELARLGNQVPVAILEDYLEGRARNHAVNRAMIEWTADGIFDYLIIPQDDTVEYGWNISERRRLNRLIQRLGVADRVSVYPGADETDMLLLARYVAGKAGFRPRIWTRYSGANGSRMRTAYEDRPMEEMVKAHLGPLNATLAPDQDKADISLYVNSPALIQGEANQQYALMLSDDDMQALSTVVTEAIEIARHDPANRDTLRELNAVGRNVEEFARSLAIDVTAGRTCALVDAAYVNGGDLALAAALERHVDLAHLAAYAGWNTAGNSLGTVLAHSVIRHLHKTEGADRAALVAHAKFLFLRFADDYLYQASVRSAIAMEELPLLGLAPRMDHLGEHAATVTQILARRLTLEAERFAADHFDGRCFESNDASIDIEAFHIRDVTLPWSRLFEMGCAIAVTIGSG